MTSENDEKKVKPRVKVKLDTVLKKLDQTKTPSGLEREVIFFDNKIFSIIEKIQTFSGKEQVEQIIEPIGIIPEGVFFARGYTARLLSENGKILAIELLKKLLKPISKCKFCGSKLLKGEKICKFCGNTVE